MGMIKDKFLNEELIKNQAQELSNLRELNDKNEMIILYQKQLLEVQGNSLKEFRKLNDRYEQLLKDYDEAIQEKPKRGRPRKVAR